MRAGAFVGERRATAPTWSDRLAMCHRTIIEQHSFDEPAMKVHDHMVYGAGGSHAGGHSSQGAYYSVADS